MWGVGGGEGRGRVDEVTHSEWHAEGTRRFGPDEMTWRFVCPVCQHVASVQDYKNAGAPEGSVGYSCIGRWQGMRRDALGLNGEAIRRGELPPAEGPGPCNYTGGGLFQLNPVAVEVGDVVTKVFAFAGEES